MPPLLSTFSTIIIPEQQDFFGTLRALNDEHIPSFRSLNWYLCPQQLQTSFSYRKMIKTPIVSQVTIFEIPLWNLTWLLTTYVGTKLRMLFLIPVQKAEKIFFWYIPIETVKNYPFFETKNQFSWLSVQISKNGYVGLFPHMWWVIMPNFIAVSQKLWPVKHFLCPKTVFWVKRVQTWNLDIYHYQIATK